MIITHARGIEQLGHRNIHSRGSGDVVNRSIEPEQITRELKIVRNTCYAWLHRLAVNLVLMRLRKKSPPFVSIEAALDRDDETASPLPASIVGGPDLLLEGSIDRINLERCIERLPVGYRTIFVWHGIQGYEHHELAGILGCSVGVSKSQLHKARTRLRELLHEVQREKTRDERMAATKLRPRSSGALLV